MLWLVDSVWQGGIHDALCVVFRRNGQFLLCDTYSRGCLALTLHIVPRGHVDLQVNAPLSLQPLPLNMCAMPSFSLSLREMQIIAQAVAKKAFVSPWRTSRAKAQWHGSVSERVNLNQGCSVLWKFNLLHCPSSVLWYSHFSVSHFPHLLCLHLYPCVYQGYSGVCVLIAKSRFYNLQILKKDEVIEWPGTLAIVHSYISYKAGNRSDGYLC